MRAYLIAIALLTVIFGSIGGIHALQQTGIDGFLTAAGDHRHFYSDADRVDQVLNTVGTIQAARR